MYEDRLNSHSQHAVPRKGDVWLACTAWLKEQLCSNQGGAKSKISTCCSCARGCYKGTERGSKCRLDKPWGTEYFSFSHISIQSWHFLPRNREEEIQNQNKASLGCDSKALITVLSWRLWWLKSKLNDRDCPERTGCMRQCSLPPARHCATSHQVLSADFAVWFIAALEFCSDGPPFFLQQKPPACKTVKMSSDRAVIGDSITSDLRQMRVSVSRPKKFLQLKPLPRDTERSEKGEEQFRRSQARSWKKLQAAYGLSMSSCRMCRL